MSLARTVAALCALAFIHSTGTAQTTTTGKQSGSKATGAKSLGGDKPVGKLLSREELRACMTQQAELKSSQAELERERGALESEKGDIQQVGVALKAEREELGRRGQEAAAAFKQKLAAHQERVDAFKKRHALYNEMVEKATNSSRIEREQMALEKERLALVQQDEAIRAEAAALDAEQSKAVNAYNDRSQANDRRADDWNQRNAALADRINARQTTYERWQSQCANRPYREDDEIAIKAGK